MTTIFNCADCRKAIKENSREHDDCWTNMEKGDDLWYCGDCKCDHMDEDDLPELVIPQAHNIGEFYTEEEQRKIYEALKAEFETKDAEDDDFDVDDRDAPNVRPYKKCSVCGDRKSCGSYKENDWFCEDCYEEEDADAGEACVDDNDRSYGPRGPPAPESDDDDDDDMSECDCCGEMFELGTFNIAEDAECNQEAYCDECWKLKIEDGCVWQDENGEWVC